MALIVTPGQLRQSSEFYRELASLMGAGIPAVQSLQTIMRSPPALRYRLPLSRAIRLIEGGEGFTTGLEVGSGLLGPLEVALLRAGEESGRLVESCRSLADHFDQRARLLGMLLLKLVYPAFLFHLAVLVFPTSVMADLVLKGAGAAFLTQKLAVLIPVYGVALGLAAALQEGRNEVWRGLVERLLSWVPVLGKARSELAMSRLASALEALIGAGLGIVESWELAARASGSPAVERRVQSWSGRIRSGVVPSELVSGAREFPEMFANLYLTGEMSGKLDQELRHLRDYYQEAGMQKLNVFVLGMVVAVSLGVMVGVGYFVIRFWMNYFNQISNAGGF